MEHGLNPARPSAGTKNGYPHGWRGNPTDRLACWSNTRIQFFYPWDCLAIRGDLMTAPNWIKSRLKLACLRRNEPNCTDRMPKESRRGAEDFFSRSAVSNDLYYGFYERWCKSGFHPCFICG